MTNYGGQQAERFVVCAGASGRAKDSVMTRIQRDYPQAESVHRWIWLPAA